MQNLENYSVAKKPAMILVSLIIVGLSTHLLPKEMAFIAQMGSVVAYFSAGMLAAQHARIWDKAQRIGRDPKE